MKPRAGARAVLVAVVAGLLGSGCLSFTFEVWIRNDGSGRVLDTVAFDDDFVRLAALRGGDPFAAATRELEGLRDRLAKEPGVRWSRLRVRQEAGGRQFDLEFDLDDVQRLPTVGRAGRPTPAKAPGTDAFRVERVGRTRMAIEAGTTLPGGELPSGLADGETAQALMGAMLKNDLVTVRIHAPRIVSGTGTISADRRVVEWRIPLADVISPTRRGALPRVRAEVDLRPWARPVTIALAALALLVLVTAIAVPRRIPAGVRAGLAAAGLLLAASGAWVYVDSARIGPPPASPPPVSTLKPAPPGLAIPLTLPPSATPPPTTLREVDLGPILARVHDPDVMTRARALQELETLGPRASAAAPDLISLLAETQGVIRVRTLRALGRIGPGNARALVPFLSDPDTWTRIEAACALASTEYAGMTPALLTNAMAERDETIRGRVAECLGDLGPRAQRSVPVLMGAAADTKGGSFARYHAVEALGRIGPAAGEAVPLLTRATQDPDSYVRNAAAEALRRVSPGPTGSPSP